MLDCKACVTFEFQLYCLLLILQCWWYVSPSWIQPRTRWFGVMDGNVSQQDPTQELLHFKNSPVTSRAESRVCEEPRELRWDTG